MWSHAVSFDQLDEVEGVQNEEQQPQEQIFAKHRTVDGRWLTGEHRDERTASDCELRPKPPMRVAVDAESLPQTLQSWSTVSKAAVKSRRI